MSQQGKVYIVSAPSGAGKTSLLKAFIKNQTNLGICVSHTTRKPRPLEINGVHYHFVSKDVFEQMIKEGAFIEYAQVFDHYYGTSKNAISVLTEKGLDVILEIDWQGATQARENFKSNCVSIFILPPSLSALYERLKKRGQDSDEIIQRRMQDAKNEVSHANEYDYVIVNDDFDEALKDLEACFRVQKLKSNLDYQL
ncbi:guanylate kinase [Fastidiosibacter lacustris]|uniref:guanylate kinase n=1 Tax=Fastidiosibacter lacustris TaxID=2056695 RepID=UPI000E350FD3|nr:guanylate kinase [Fastidiosibacter lacustris]